VLSPGPEDSRPDQAAIRAAFAEMPLEDLTALDEAGARAGEALTSIGAKMRGEAGLGSAPDFGLLTAQFAKLTRVCRDQLALRSPGGRPAGAVETESVSRAGFVGGAIRSRQDAILALEAVADFFRHNEPSSPIPLIVDRAKRLVAKDFLEVLADIAPDALAVARSAGGLRDQQS
jgi:type VI secretion system protein ImpA